MTVVLRIERLKPLKARLYLRRKPRHSTRNRPYYLLLVFADLDIMRAYLVEQAKLASLPIHHRQAGHYQDTLGCATWFGRAIRRRQVGTIILCRDYLGSGIVGHEIAHAALYWITKGAFPYVFRRCDDEHLASVCGDMTSQYNRWFYRQLDRQRCERQRRRQRR